MPVLLSAEAKDTVSPDIRYHHFQMLIGRHTCIVILDVGIFLLSLQMQTYLQTFSQLVVMAFQLHLPRL